MNTLCLLDLVALLIALFLDGYPRPRLHVILGDVLYVSRVSRANILNREGGCDGGIFMTGFLYWGRSFVMDHDWTSNCHKMPAYGGFQ